MLKRFLRLTLISIIITVLASGCTKTEQTVNTDPDASREQATPPAPEAPADTEADATKIKFLDATYVILGEVGDKQTEILYDGTKVTIGEGFEAEKGKKFVLVKATLENTISQEELNKINLSISGKSVAPSSQTSDIQKFGYDSLLTAVEASAEKPNVGQLLYIVTTEDSKTSDADWKLVYGDTTVSLSGKYHEDMIVNKGIVQDQYDRELEISRAYSAGNFGLANPYIVQDPYSLAPLTALVMFKTESPAKINVDIIGKTEDATISYSYDEASKYHEIPIIGMYAGYDNKVVLTAVYEDNQSEKNELTITTAPLSENVTVTKNELQNNKDKLIYMVDAKRTVIDLNGDTRWFTTLDKTAPSSTTNFLDNGHFLISRHPYEFNAELYEMDFLGKIYWTFNDGAAFHHDSTVDPDGNWVLFNKDLTAVQPYTGNIVNTLSWSKLFQKSDSMEIRTLGTGDWLHPNSMVFTDSDSIMLSFRNKHMVIQLNYYTGEIEWVLSPTKEQHEYLGDKFLTPAGEVFEWFYSQHNATFLGDLDNNPDTIDIMLFDNGDARSLTADGALPKEQMYSRVVQYRINQKDMTVSQLWSVGKELGNEYSSPIHSGAQYLYDEDGAVLVAFDSAPNQKIAEFNKDGEITWQADFNWTIYRAYKKEKSSLTKGLNRILEGKPGITVLENKPEKVDNNMEMAQFAFNIHKMEQNNQFLSMAGWGVPLDVKLKKDNVPYVYLVGSDETYRYKLNKTVRSYLFNEGGLSKTEDSESGGKAESFGYLEPYLDMSGLPDGKYDVYLAMDTGDSKILGQKLPYTVDLKLLSNSLMWESTQDNAVEAITVDSQSYKLSSPNVILNPFKVAPLTAIAAFATEKEAKISIEVVGKDENSTIKHDVEKADKQHFVEILGLYADYENTVKLTANYTDGTTEQKELKIKTDPLPENMIKIEVAKAEKELMAPGINFMYSTANALVGFDNNGEIRWYTLQQTELTNYGMCKKAKNGHLFMMGGDFLAPYYYSKVYEMDLLGRIYKVFHVPYASAHHDIQELPSGNIVVLAGDVRDGYIDDLLIEFDRKTTAVAREIDLKDVLKLKDFLGDGMYVEANLPRAKTQLEQDGIAEPTEEQIRKRAEEPVRHDWLHLNACTYNEKDNSITLSGRNQNMLIKLDYETLEIKWILADPEMQAVKDNPHIQEKLLIPVDPNFIYAYGQHGPQYFENGDLIFFDNHYSDKAGYLNPDEKSMYSRALTLRIDEQTKKVSVVEEYGRTDPGNETFSSYISNTMVFGDKHYLIDFGGILYDKNTGIRSRNMALMGSPDGITTARFIEIKDGEVIFDASTTGLANNNVYRIFRMDLYN